MVPNNQSIFDEIRQAIENISYGSVEVIVQNGTVTQISTRIIKKTNIRPASQPVNGVRILKKKTGSGININLKY